MGSAGYNQYPWSSYENKDCSLQLCSIYCPQFCYLIFPPPPPPEDDSGTPFSPLIIAIIGVLASALILITYYTIATRYCRRRNVHDSRIEDEENHHQLSDDQCQNVCGGLDEGVIKSIKVQKYRKGDGSIEGSECAVCLSEFEENESLRLLPKCDHAFHLPCIDTWLKSHSNCPLCRANVVVLAQNLPVVEMNSYETHQPEDLVLVVDDQERISNEEYGNAEDSEDRSDLYEKSVCLGGFSCQRQLMISDILRIEEIDEDLLVENFRSCGSSMGLQRSPVSSNMHNDKGKNSIDIGRE